MTSNEWRDFVIFPADPNRVLSPGARFDLSLQAEGAQVVGKDQIVWPGDEFEALDVDRAGSLLIWTKQRVWVVRRENGMERLMYLPRYPGVDEGPSRAR